MTAPDTGFSWVIVASCGFTHFALSGPFRSVGILYVALLQAFNVTREEAAWPFSLCAAVYQLISPVTSILTHYMSQRSTCILGSAIATSGVAACYFANSIAWFIVLFGIVHGLGFGLLITLLPVILNQYFIKYRATAIGLAFSGGPISSFIFPIVIKWLLDTYGLNGTFLILGGIVMHTLVATSLLRTPTWIKNKQYQIFSQDTKKPEIIICSNFQSNFEAKAMEQKVLLIENCCPQELSNREKNSVLFGVPQQCSSEERNDKSVLSCDESSSNIFSSNNSDSHNCIKNHLDSSMNLEKNLQEIQSHEDKCINTESCDRAITANEVRVPLVKYHEVSTIPNDRATSKASGNRTFHLTIASILKRPMFHLITFTLTIYFFGLYCLLLVIVDYAEDKGIPEEQGIYLISMFSLTDLIGRSCLGWVTDRKFITRKNLLIVNLLVIGLLNHVYPLINSFTSILVAIALHGLAVGSSLTLFFLLQADYFGLKRLTLTVGLTSFINGLLSLLRPSVIGLFRDVIGSYDWLFHFTGAVILMFSIFWIIESYINKQNLQEISD